MPVRAGNGALQHPCPGTTFGQHTTIYTDILAGDLQPLRPMTRQMRRVS